LRSCELLLEGEGSAFGGEGFGLRLRGAIAEGYAGSGLVEEADGGCSDAARAAGDKGGAAGEGEVNAGGSSGRSGGGGRVCWCGRDGTGLILHPSILHPAGVSDIQQRTQAATQLICILIEE
jgi:hypothetical protein